jgi:hypothetical protein
MSRIMRFTLLVSLTIVAAPLSASAQCIQVTPESWDYSDVKVGTSESQIFTIENCASVGLTVWIIEIREDTTGAFTITSAPPCPQIIPGWESREVEVTFAPPSLGAHEAVLYIFSNAPGNHTYVNLSGVGVRRWRYFEAEAAP